MNLHDAARRGNVQRLKELLDSGDDINAIDSEDTRGTPLHWAIGNGQREVVKVLLGRGADIEAKDGAGQTPLMLAAQLDERAPCKGMAELLVNGGADFDAKDRNGVTVLTKPCRVFWRTGRDKTANRGGSGDQCHRRLWALRAALGNRWRAHVLRPSIWRYARLAEASSWASSRGCKALAGQGCRNRRQRQTGKNGV